MENLYEILIPVKPNDVKPFDLRYNADGGFTDEHHKEFFENILTAVGGYTKLPTVEGAWMGDKKLYIEAMIPVRVMTDSETIDYLANIAKTHYEQEAIFVANLGTAKIV